jgi:hypothetical protein
MRPSHLPRIGVIVIEVPLKIEYNSCYSFPVLLRDNFQSRVVTKPIFI